MADNLLIGIGDFNLYSRDCSGRQKKTGNVSNLFR